MTPNRTILSNFKVVVRTSTDNPYPRLQYGSGFSRAFSLQKVAVSPTHSKDSSRQSYVKENSGDTVYSVADGGTEMEDALV